MNKKLIIKGSSRKDGNTKKVIDYLNKNNNFDIVDLLDYHIGPFDYQNKNHTDDFLPLMEKIITEYDTIVFASPVYWYSMSGTMKIFFDRISDLLTYKKELGRQLRGKNMAMLSNSGHNDRKTGFEMPFVESATYLGMEYLGDIHAWVIEDEIHSDAKKIIDTFKDKLISH
tara:strand:+ start:29409 stop:29921 length:513 start_codon:yes stop_codon:yes gene_type:complete